MGYPSKPPSFLRFCVHGRLYGSIRMGASMRTSASTLVCTWAPLCAWLPLLRTRTSSASTPLHFYGHRCLLTILCIYAHGRSYAHGRGVYACTVLRAWPGLRSYAHGRLSMHASTSTLLRYASTSKGASTHTGVSTLLRFCAQEPFHAHRRVYASTCIGAASTLLRFPLIIPSEFAPPEVLD